MMDTPTKKFIVVGGALVALVLVSCGLTGCKAPWIKGGNQDNSTVSDTSTAEIPGLPPDPGEAGKATLAGIDSDNDGVRDDVQRYIAMTYRDSAKTRAVLTQYAKQMQSALLDASSKELSMKHADEYSKVSECGESILGFDMSYKVEKDIKPIILNTDERNKAYFTYNDQLGGEIFFLNNQGVSACDFDVASLPN
jgi:hypothetical protein